MRRVESDTPGGQRVTVTLEVENGRLAAVRVDGDYADAIASALNGTPADADVPAIAARVRAAVPFGAELVGTTPEAVALAVVRAVNGPRTDRIGTFTPAEIDRLTSEWPKLPWRLLHEVPLSPALNVALDEVLTDRVAAGRCPPTLRFWGWESPAVVIGRCQSVTNEVDREAAAARGFAVVRRMSGGGAMFVQPHGAITYSLYLPEAAVEGLNIRQSYEVCEAWVIRGLRELGIDAHHVPINDIACGEGKIGGAAQARRKRVVLHHTTMAYDMDPAEMAAVLRVGRVKLKEKAVASAAKTVAPLARRTGRARAEIAAQLFASFRARYGGTPSELTAEEVTAAAELVQSKYGNPAWTEEFE